MATKVPGVGVARWGRIIVCVWTATVRSVNLALGGRVYSGRCPVAGDGPGLVGYRASSPATVEAGSLTRVCGEPQWVGFVADMSAGGWLRENCGPEGLRAADGSGALVGSAVRVSLRVSAR